MQKLVLMSIIISSIVIPVRAARSKNARAGLKAVVKQTMIFNLVYLLLLIFVAGRV